MIRVVLGVVAIATAAAIAVFGFGLGTGRSDGVSYRFAQVDRGRIVNAVSASGKLRPVTTVQVGSQISGRILQLHADFNTVVQAGQIVARIDPANFEAKVAEARADLAVAKANVAMNKANIGAMEADIKGARAALAEAEQNLVRRKQLFERRVLAESEIEKAVSARDQARSRLDSTIAKLETQRAQLANSEAQVDAKTATLRQRQLDLEYTIIRSPVDGVVISRNVDIGQTVAASLQAPVLFQIAQDLRQMEVEVSVDEADIGRVAEDQIASFTVDAFPSRDFSGRVRQIRKAPVEVSNVVTYAVVVTTDNSDQVLLPGMTANVSIVTGERSNVLRIANAALRYRPRGEPATTAQPGPGSTTGGAGAGAQARIDTQVQRLTEALTLTADQQAAVRAILAETGQMLRSMRAEGAAQQDVRAAGEKARTASRVRIEALLDEDQRKRYRAMRSSRGEGQNRRSRVWVLDRNGVPKVIPIVTGLADATVSEVVSGDLKEGDQVIVSATESAPPRRPLGF